MEGGGGSCSQDSPEVDTRGRTRNSGSTSSTPDGSAFPGEEGSTTGESGEILDALLYKFEPSSRVEGEARGWGETLSHQAVEELNQSLLNSGDHAAKPPPPYDGESRTQNLSLEPRGVEPTSKSRPRGIKTNPGSSHRGVRSTFETSRRPRRNSNSYQS